jgi:hypothetical protein
MRRQRQISILFILIVLAAVPGYAVPTISSLACANPGSTKATDHDTSINANSCTDFSYGFTNPQSTNGANNWLYGYYGGLVTAQGVVPPLFLPSSFHAMTPVYLDANGLPSGAPPTATNGVHPAGWWAVDFTRYWTALDAFGGHPNSPNTDLHSAPYCNQGLYQNCGSGYDTRGRSSPGSAEQWAVRRYVAPVAFDGFVDIVLQVQKDPNSQGGDGDGNYVIRYSNGVATQLGALSMPATGPVQTLVLTHVQLHAGDFLDFAIAPNQSDFNDGEFQLITIKGEPLLVSIPEPASFALAGLGLLLVALKRRR